MKDWERARMREDAVCFVITICGLVFMMWLATV